RPVTGAPYQRAKANACSSACCEMPEKSTGDRMRLNRRIHHRCFPGRVSCPLLLFLNRLDVADDVRDTNSDQCVRGIQSAEQRSPHRHLGCAMRGTSRGTIAIGDVTFDTLARKHKAALTRKPR